MLRLIALSFVFTACSTVSSPAASDGKTCTAEQKVKTVLHCDHKTCNVELADRSLAKVDSKLVKKGQVVNITEACANVAELAH